MALTPQQLQAIACRDASVVLASGAGCGKTHVLTERYLDHLRRDGAEVGQLLAITFTDRAARQMRDRIRRAIAAELHQANDEQAGRWARHLRALETAHISTIHAFCSALLRQHAIEAGLDPAFEVLEEVLAINLREEAVTGRLQELLTADTPLADDLRELIILHGWAGMLGGVQSLMHDWEPAAWQAWLERPPEQVAADWQEREARRLLPAYIDFLIRGVPRISRCLRLLETTPCLGPKMRSYIALILHQFPRLAEADDLETAINDILGVCTVRPELARAWESQEVYEAIRDALSAFRTELRSRLALFLDQPEDLADAVVVGQRFLRLADAAARAYQQRKQAEGVVDFDDLLRLARDLLRGHAEVREGLQRRYRFVLIDELQDTDPVQHELVAHLCGAGLTDGKLFAVGDHQQSIYRFRGADVERFTALRQHVPEAGRLPLSVNFRSQPAILHFANALFARHLAHFQALDAHHPQVNAGPCVEFLWSQEPDVRNQESESGDSGLSSDPNGERGQRSQESDDDEADGHQKWSVREQREAEADLIAWRIRQLLETGDLLVRDASRSALRAVTPGDITLLFRTMSHVGIYEAALRRQGLDYYLVGGRAFFAQQEIYDLLHLLRSLENPQDSLSLAGTLRSPFCCLSDEALFWLGRHTDGLWAGLHDPATLAKLTAEQRQRAERAGRWLDRWREQKDRLPIARLIGLVFADTGYDAAMQFEFLGERKLANLWKLQELARTFDRSGRFGLAEFIARLGDLVSAQPREEQAATQPENANVIRIMSIHQSKGLEFSVVILADLASGGRDPHYPPAVWHPTLGCVARPPREEEGPLFDEFGWQLWRAGEAICDWHEELRVLYVACTRAEDYLILSASQPAVARNAWMLLLGERFDLATGACLDPTIPTERRPLVRVTTDVENVQREAPSSERPPSAPLATGGAAPIAVRINPGDIVTLAGLLAWRKGARDLGVLNQMDPPLAGILSQPDDAITVQRDLEYLLKPATGSRTSLFAPAELPGLRGRVDCLWQDQDQRWHLIGWRAASRTPEEERLSLALAAHAVEQQTGDWPASVSLFEDGKLERIAEKELRDPKWLKWIEESLLELLEQRLTPDP